MRVWNIRALSSVINTAHHSQWSNRHAWIQLINQCHRSIDANEDSKTSLKSLVKNSWILDEDDSSVNVHLHFYKLSIKKFSKKNSQCLSHLLRV